MHIQPKITQESVKAVSQLCVNYANSLALSFECFKYEVTMTPQKQKASETLFDLMEHSFGHV